MSKLDLVGAAPRSSVRYMSRNFLECVSLALVRSESLLLASQADKDKGDDSKAGGEGGAGKKTDTAAASQVRASINSSLDDVKKKGKLSQKEAMEIMIKMMALQKMENKAAGVAAGGATGGGGGDEEAPGCTMAGATANVAIITKKEVIVANAGDSRAVLCTKGVAKQLSFDHKPNHPTETARITAAGD